MSGFRPVLVAVMRPTFVGPDRPIDLLRQRRGIWNDNVKNIHDPLVLTLFSAAYIPIIWQSPLWVTGG
jgi:hypothetical protein